MAVASRDRKRAESFATEHPISQVFDDYAGLLASGEIDAVYNREVGGGSLFDVGCYPITFSRFAFGDEPLGIQSTCTIDPQYGVDTRPTLLLEFPGQHFHDCILDGTEPMKTAANSIGTLRIIEEVLAAAS